MTAPDAQPPAELDAVNPHWSPTTGLLWWEDGTYVTVEGGEIVEDGFALPADAVRLVASTWAGLLSILDEHYPADVFMGGEGSDPGPRIVALAREVAQLRASAALAGTTTPTAEAEVVEAAREFVRHTEMAIDAGWSGLGRPVFPYCELRAAVALLASTPTEETDHAG